MSEQENLSQLLGDADLDEEATGALQLAAGTLGPAIMAGLGSVQLDDITTSEVVLVTLLVDDSGSIRFGKNTQNVRDGHNLIIDSLLGAKQSASVLVSCRYLNEEPGVTNQNVLYPYVMLENAPRLDSHNYNPQGGTPLYQQSVITLAGVVAKMTEFEQGGVAARAVTAIITDGGDNGWSNPSVQDVNRIISGMLHTEQHIIMGMGMQDPDWPVDFNDVFRQMGIKDEWILTPGATQSEVRAAFATVSQSAVRASQTAASFSQTALGGFGNIP
jgi:hypothetical protein